MRVIKTAKPFIFLVDDDYDDRQLFSEALEAIKMDYRITTFTNGVDLMANLIDPSTELPNYIFLDLNMPLMNGEECLDDIRGELNFANIRVIIYSGYYDEEEVNRLLNKGADQYLQKPKSFKELKIQIENCFSA
ncbi:response regulator [Maribacter hydrothermalis]|uniref:Response regulatory domain-containing protein n=1 Tax=Maribacter hydrothermalis TaxID=1836467 RepID=A0A1B7Z1E2_9FLAO|nr:response regulator [Maribacter hydrothermalis]APQ18157.1 hypothetical protein BTR34_12860 [Maribacter hydrothermalis]OBR36504.1 hypothetical protein A9200_08750 [Maribacter hydrothermalis]